MPGVKGRSGRRAKPTAKKQLAGNPGKRALNTAEPSFSQITNIEPPDWISDMAKEMWARVCPELCREQVLTITDLHNLEIFCSAYATWREAQVEIATNGITVEGATGGLIKNPALTAANEASRQMATFGSLLGLDPSSRQRLIGGSKKQGSNPFLNL